MCNCPAFFPCLPTPVHLSLCSAQQRPIFQEGHWGWSTQETENNLITSFSRNFPLKMALFTYNCCLCSKCTSWKGAFLCSKLWLRIYFLPLQIPLDLLHFLLLIVQLRTVFLQSRTEATVDRHFIPLVSVVMASPHIYSPSALLYCAGEKVTTLLREYLHGMACSCQRPEKIKSCYFWNKKKKWESSFWKLQQFPQGQL